MSRSYDGTGDWSISTSPPVTDVPLSVSFWFRLQSTATDQVIVCLGANATQTGFGVYYSHTDTGSINTFTASTGFAEAKTTTKTTDTAGWHHALGVWASTSSRASYLDGAGKGTNATAETSPTVNRLNVATYPDQTAIYTGMVQQLAIWNTNLADADATNLAAGVSPLLISPANLKCYMPYMGREGTGNDFDLVNGVILTTTNAVFNASEPNIGIGNPSPLYQRMISRVRFSI